MASSGYPAMSGGINQPQMQPQFQPQMQPQFQPQYNPYFYGYGFPPPPPPSNQYHNSGTETIQGNTVQTGTFKGHGTGARIQGGFTASGNIQ